MRDRAQCFGKILLWQEWPKIVKRWPKNGVFELFRKIYSLVFSGNGVNENAYDPLTFCENRMIGKNLFPKLWPNMLSANQISVVFNHQYLINGLTSDSDFLYVDRREWTRQDLLKIFPKKISSRADRPYSAKKWCISLLSIRRKDFFEILRNKRVQEGHTNYINGFSKKKSHLRQMGHFRSKNVAYS